MRDVLARLMEWMEASDIDDAHIVLRDAITEIAGLRARLDEYRLAIRRLADQDATLSVIDGEVNVEIGPHLTGEERLAVVAAAELAEETAEALDDGDCQASVLHYGQMAATLRGLIARCALGSEEGRSQFANLENGIARR